MKTNWYDQFEKLHSLIKYLSSTYMSSTVLGAEDTARKQNKKNLPLREEKKLYQVKSRSGKK